MPSLLDKQTSRFWIKTYGNGLISNVITIFPVHAARLRKHSSFIKLPQLTPHQSHGGKVIRYSFVQKLLLLVGKGNDLSIIKHNLIHLV